MTDEPITLLVDMTCELPAAPEDVFAVIGDHRALARWIPGLRAVEVDESRADSPGGAGTRRTLRMGLGPPGVEVVTVFAPPHRIAYGATDESLRGLCTCHAAELTCTPSGGGTVVRWTVRARLSTSWWRRWLAPLMFRLVCRAGLRRLRRLLAVGPSWAG